MITAGYPCVMTEYSGGLWGNSHGGFDADDAVDHQVANRWQSVGGIEWRLFNERHDRQPFLNFHTECRHVILGEKMSAQLLVDARVSPSYGAHVAPIKVLIADDHPMVLAGIRLNSGVGLRRAELKKLLRHRLEV